MLKKTIALLSLLLLVACSQTPNGGAGENDNYYFEKKDFDRYTFQTTVVEHDNLNLLREEYKKHTGEYKSNLMAYTLIRSNSCEVHIVDPLKDFQTYYIGHEFSHCVWGQWHPKQDKTR